MSSNLDQADKDMAMIESLRRQEVAAQWLAFTAQLVPAWRQVAKTLDQTAQTVIIGARELHVALGEPCGGNVSDEALLQWVADRFKEEARGCRETWQFLEARRRVAEQDKQN